MKFFYPSDFKTKGINFILYYILFWHRFYNLATTSNNVNDNGEIFIVLNNFSKKIILTIFTLKFIWSNEAIFIDSFLFCRDLRECTRGIKERFGSGRYHQILVGFRKKYLDD